MFEEDDKSMGAQCIAPLPDLGFPVLKLDSSNMEIAKMKPDYFVMRDASAVNDKQCPR